MDTNKRAANRKAWRKDRLCLLACGVAVSLFSLFMETPRGARFLDSVLGLIGAGLGIFLCVILPLMLAFSALRR